MHNISNMLVFVGLCVMLLSIFISLKINKIVGQEKKQKWAILTSLMVFFLIGYGIFFFIQFKNIEQYLELLTGLVFLGGAIFVLLVMRLIQNTLILKNNAFQALEEKVLEYKQISEKLRHSQANLESLFNTAIPSCITGRNFDIVRANDAYYDFFGQSDQQYEGQKCFESRPGNKCHSGGCPLVRIIQGEKRLFAIQQKRIKTAIKDISLLRGNHFWMQTMR